MTWLLCGGRKWLGFSAWIEIHLVFMSRRQSWLEFKIEIDIDFISVVGRNLSWSFCGRSSCNKFLCWSNSTWFQCRGSNLTWYQCRDRTWLSFCVGVDNDLVLVSRSALKCFVEAPILTSILSADRNRRDFSRMSKWTWLLCGGRISIDLCMGGRN